MTGPSFPIPQGPVTAPRPLPQTTGIDWGSLISSGLGWVKDLLGQHGGDIALGSLGAFQALQAANASKRAGELSDKALEQSQQRWATGAPLRSQGLSGLLNRTRPDYSSTFADPTNPLARRRPLSAPGGPLPPLPTSPAPGPLTPPDWRPWRPSDPVLPPLAASPDGGASASPIPLPTTPVGSGPTRPLDTPMPALMSRRPITLPPLR